MVVRRHDVGALCEDSGAGEGEAPPVVEGFDRLDLVATGPHGRVYRASQGNRTVALKILSRDTRVEQEVLERFRRDSASRLRHPNLPTVESVAVARSGQEAVATTLLRGDSLAVVLDELRQGKSRAPSLSPLSVAPDGSVHPAFARRAAELIAEVADGLAVAHAQDLVHGAIQPRNLIFNPAGRLVLTDFGLVRAPQRHRTEELPFIAPELLGRNPGRAGTRADVYALGAVLYAVLARRPPFGGDEDGRLERAIRSGSFAPLRDVVATGGLPDVPAPLESCVEKALALRPEERYSDAGELAQDLRRFLANMRPLAQCETAVSTRKETGRLRQRSSQLTAAAVLIVFAAAMIVAFWGGKEFADRDPGLARGETKLVSRDVASFDPLQPEPQPPRYSPLASRARSLASRPSSSTVVSSAGSEGGERDSHSASPLSRPWPGPSGSTERSAVHGLSIELSSKRDEVSSAAGRDAVASWLRNGNEIEQAAALQQLRLELERGLRPASDALLASALLGARVETLRARAIELLLETGNSDSLLDALAIGESYPIVTLASSTFARFWSGLLELDAREFDRRVVSLLCSWDLPLAEELDEETFGERRRLPPNIEVVVDQVEEHGFAKRWIWTQAKLDPERLVREAHTLARRRPLLETLLESLSTIEPEKATLAVTEIAREHYIAGGSKALDVLGRLGSFTALLDLAVSELPLAFRREAIDVLAERFPGPHFPELRTIALSSPEPALRESAFLALSTCSSPVAASVIKTAVRDFVLRDHALAWLRRLDESISTPICLDLLGGPDPRAREEAMRLLSQGCRPEVYPQLLQKLLDSASSVREDALAVLQAYHASGCTDRLWQAAAERAEGFFREIGEPIRERWERLGAAGARLWQEVKHQWKEN